MNQFFNFKFFAIENEEIEQFSKRKRRRLNAVYYNEDNEEKPAGKLEWNFVQEDIDLTLDSPKKSLVAAKTLVERSNSNVESTVARQSLNFVTTAHPNGKYSQTVLVNEKSS